MQRIAVTALLALLALLGFAAISHAGAQEATGTLAKLKRTGTITLGVRDGSVPFSYLDDQQRYIGYSVDLCLKVVDALRAQLALPGLKVKQRDGRLVEMYLFVAVVYFVLCYALSRLVERLQQRVYR